MAKSKKQLDAEAIAYCEMNLDDQWNSPWNKNHKAMYVRYNRIKKQQARDALKVAPSESAEALCRQLREGGE